MSPGDLEAVTRLLGREPQADFEVIVRRDGEPVVIRNAPLLRDGTPMPTRYWLVDPALNEAISRIEAGGGVRAAETEVDAGALEVAHRRYAEERDAALPAGHSGPRPSGGVGGTSRGVKCLHAHYANLLAGNDDPIGRWVASRLTVAAIDMGTNSTRLLVADATGAPLDRRMRITRLGQGVDAGRRILPEAIDRTVDALREYRDALSDHGVERFRAVATSAARDAANADEFMGAVRAVLGQDAEVLTGGEEARLSFEGATAGVDAPAPYLVVDIGGGSTELVVGTDEPEGLVSLDMGCVRVTEQFLASDPPTPEELSQAVQVVRLHLDDADRAVPPARDAKTLIGVAGTVTTMAAIDMGLAEYDRERIHHYVMTRAGAEEVFRTLATEPAELRRHNPGLEPGRVDVIVGGAVVLVSVMRHYEMDEMLVSEDDILDGIVRSQLP